MGEGQVKKGIRREFKGQFVCLLERSRIFIARCGVWI